MHAHRHHHAQVAAAPVEPGMAHGGHGAHEGHDKHAGHSVAMFRDKFWISLLLTIPTLAWGHMLQRALGYTPPQIPGARWIAAVFGTAVFLYGGWPFIQGAVRELRDRLPAMMTLIALAITVAFAFSAAVTLGYPGMPLWEELITLSRVSYRKMVQNLWWASGYNILAIPLAAGVLASKGIVLSPAAGAVLMSLSTVIVAINAQLLRRARL